MSHTLLKLERAFCLSWSADTTCLDAKSLTKWHPDNAAHGQCGPTALIVQDLLGGDLLIAEVSGGNEGDEVHYWNRFSGGFEIDLTREQFKSHRIIGSPASSSGQQKDHERTSANTNCFAPECCPR